MGKVQHAEFMTNLIRRYKVRQIVHCAASVVVPESVALPMSYYANNVMATFDLMRLAIMEKVEGFVFSSSAAVYGQPEFRQAHPRG
jgi:UDP-glucose 4-epimerase